MEMGLRLAVLKPGIWSGSGGLEKEDHPTPGAFQGGQQEELPTSICQKGGKRKGQELVGGSEPGNTGTSSCAQTSQ